MTTPNSTCSLEYPQGEDPVERQAKKKAAIIHLETSCVRSLFLKFFHVMQVLFSSQDIVCYSGKDSPQLHVGIHNVLKHFHAFIHAMSYFESCVSVDVCMKIAGQLAVAEVFANGGLMNKLNQMLFCFYISAGRKNTALLSEIVLLLRL